MMYFFNDALAELSLADLLLSLQSLLYFQAWLFSSFYYFIYIYIFTSISSQIFLSYRHVIKLFLSCFFAVYLHLKRTCAQHKLMEMTFSAYILKDMHPELDHLNTSFSSPGCIFKLIIQTYKTVLKKLFLDQYNVQETVGKDVKFFRYL